MELESVSRELKMLAGRERLTASELERARDLMIHLKGMGMSNLDIVELGGGRWSESTIKGYTRGIRATDPEPWQSTTALFSEMLSRNLTLADVSKAMSVTTELEGMGSSLGEIASFVAELEGEGIGVKAFASLLSDWHKAGLKSADARSALNYKSQLEQAGLDIDTLSHIAEAAGKFDGSGGVLEAVAKYGNLEELDQEVQNRREQLDAQASELDSRRQELDAIEQGLEKARNELAAKEETLATYERLKAIGFDEQGLGELAKAAGKYGTPHKVLRAINLFGELTKIKATDDELRKKVNQKRAMIERLDKQYLHLKEPIEMCRRLLKRKFGLSALSQVNAMALRYGKPTEVMKAIEAYGALEEIEKKTAQTKAKLAEIEGKLQALKETYIEQSARNRAILDQLEALNARAIEVGRTVGSIEEQLKGDTMARDLLVLLQNPTSASYENSLPLVLVLLRCITFWSKIHEGKVHYPSLVRTNLEELLRHLGGS